MKRIILVLIILLNISAVFAQKKLTHVVYFDTDKHELPQTEHNRLLLFISQLADIEIKSISIYGFCDDRGASTYNLELSKRRANSIKSIFAENEISGDLISNVDGKGEILLRIIDDVKISEIRGLNRKVEIDVIPKTDEEKRLEALSEEERESPQEKLKLELKAGDKIILNNILFRTGYTYLTKDSRKVLTEIAEILAEREDVYFIIQGHVCCTQNSRDAIDRKTKLRNLSAARAKYIYDYFVKKGISEKRMKHVGKRRLEPLGGDPKYDRRVEILITYAGGKPYASTND